MLRLIESADFRINTPLHEWQEKKLLRSHKISDHIAIDEIADKSGELIINELMLDYFERIRREYGQPIVINSGYRTIKRQNELKAEGYRAADISTHCCGWALDIDYTTDAEFEALKKCINIVNDRHFSGYCRTGYADYRELKQTFFHIDIAPLAYEKLHGKFLNGNRMPESWGLKGYEW